MNSLKTHLCDDIKKTILVKMHLSDYFRDKPFAFCGEGWKKIEKQLRKIFFLHPGNKINPLSVDEPRNCIVNMVNVDSDFLSTWKQLEEAQQAFTNHIR